MRNALDDLNGVSIMLREQERMGGQFRTLIEAHERATRDLISRSSQTWNDLANQHAIHTAELITASDVNRNAFSAAAAAAEAANASISRMLADAHASFVLPDVSITKGLAALSDSSRDAILGINAWKGLESQIADIVWLSSRAQTVVAGLVPDRMGATMFVSADTREALCGSLFDLSNSYQSLIESFEKSHSSFLSLTPSLARMPTVEYYNGAVLGRAIADFEEGDDFTEDEVSTEASDSLDGFLVGLNPKLIELLHGARQALSSRNPDRARHFSISFRELFMHVLHALAPDHEIQEWSCSQDHYVDGRPTRRARLQFICREINQAPFEKFVGKDIDAVLEFLQLFHKGAHELGSQYTSRQLKALQTRMESAIRFLFEISSRE